VAALRDTGFLFFAREINFGINGESKYVKEETSAPLIGVSKGLHNNFMYSSTNKTNRPKVEATFEYLF